MRTCTLCLLMVWTGVVLARGQGTPPSPPGASSSQLIRPIGMVTQIRTDSLSLRTDAGPELLVSLPDTVSVLRIPPGAKDLKTATKITVGDIRVGDRVLIRGRVSDDQTSMLATSVVVMAKTDLEKAREAERIEWQRRGIGGLVKAVNQETKEITISVPTTPPTPGNPTHPVIIAAAESTVLLRYAPDSVKFSDAKPSTFQEIKVGDQVRALGTKSEDGNRFAAQKLVSGTFRNIGATVVSADVPNGTVTVKDLATGKPVVVRTNPDSKLHRLPPFVAQMIALFNSGAAPGMGMPSRPAASSPGSGPPAGGMAGRPGGPNGGPRDFQQMLERSPALTLGELKPGEALIVVSTAGANPLEVTAIVLLAGVEPILAARPMGSTEVNLGWNLGMGGGEGSGGP
jgi:hypothetical protein